MAGASAPSRDRLVLPPEGSSVGVARRLVRRALAPWGTSDLVDTAVLLTSELVTNAVVHAGTDVEVACQVRPGSVEVEVVDRYPARSTPVLPAAPAPDAEGGRGLALAAALATSWGVEYSAGRKRVWFRLDRPDAVAVVHPGPPGLPTPRDDDATGDGRDGSGPGPVVAVVRTDPAGAVAHWSTEAEALFGRTAEDVTGRPFGALVAWTEGHDTPVPDAGDVARVLTLPRWQGSYAVRRPDGTTSDVFAVHVRTGSAPGDRAAVCLLVPADHRWVLGVPLLPTGPAADGEAGQGTRPDTAGPARESLDGLLQRVAERARDLLDADAAYALLSADEDDLLELRASTGLPHRVHGRHVLVESLRELPGGSSRVPVVRDGDAADAVPVLRGSALQSLVAVPLTVEDRVVGSLGVAGRTPARFTTDDAVRLQGLADGVALSVENARLGELDRRRRGWLGFLAEASDLLAGTLDPDMTAAMVAQLVVPRMARWCAVHVDDDAERRLAYLWHEDESRLDALRDALADPGGAPDDDTVLAVPLAARGRRLGTLTLGRPGATRFRREDVELVEDLARRAALALDNARLYAERTRAAEALQRSLLPPTVPHVPGVDVGVAYAAAGEGNEVGGDFYDVFRVDDARWGFAVGDVCGKGPEAAAVTGLARHTLRLLARKGEDVADVLAQLNEAVLEEAGGDRFITLLFGTLAPRAGGGADLVLVSAGHPLPVRVSPDGDVTPVGTPQTLLGVLPGETFRAEQHRLAPGEALVAVTDGVTERRHGGGTFFGETGLAQALRTTAGATAATTATRVEQAVRGHDPGTLGDDMAVLVLRALPGGG